MRFGEHPYDYAYLEKRASAIECNLEYWQINELVIKNDFMGSYEQADAIALMDFGLGKIQGLSPETYYPG